MFDFLKRHDEDYFETVDPIVEQRRKERVSKPVFMEEEKEIVKEETKIEETIIPVKEPIRETIKETKVNQPISHVHESVKKDIKKEVRKQPVVPEKKKVPYEMSEIISPMTGRKEKKDANGKGTTTKKTVKKKSSGLVTVISPFYGEIVKEEPEETNKKNSKKETNEPVKKERRIKTKFKDKKEEKKVQEKVEKKTEKKIEPKEERIPTVEENLRNIARIVEEEQDELKIIEERTGEFRLDFSGKKSEEPSLIDEIDDNMSLDELMSLYERKFKD